MRIIICFGQYGPYHHARVVALQRLIAEGVNEGNSRLSIECIPLQISSHTTTYAWTNDQCELTGTVAQTHCKGLRTLCRRTEEFVSPLEVFNRARTLFHAEKVDVALLPSYSPARYFALFAAAKSLGLRTVMMNESHAGTERATGWRKWVKRQIVQQFDAALVGGEPHKRHFTLLGMPPEKIFTGYDAVDNQFFISRCEAVRSCAKEQISCQRTYGLPDRYFLSLGRMVEKKNLLLLVEAYASYCAKLLLANDNSDPKPPVDLVFVGSGALDQSLREKARSLGLRVVDRSEATLLHSRDRQHDVKTEIDAGERGRVFFYGFRQIEENAIFYALAEAFVLPSLKEEWGLVVNEAMASSLPVIVSRAAGCAEDLVRGKQNFLSAVDLEQRLNGFVFDPSSAGALAKALFAISESPHARIEMGKKSSEIIANYSCGNFARQALRAVEATL